MSRLSFFKRLFSRPPPSFAIVSPRPRLKLSADKTGLVWICDGGGTKAYGVGPSAAYALWQQQQMTRAYFAIKYSDGRVC